MKNYQYTGWEGYLISTYEKKYENIGITTLALQADKLVIGAGLVVATAQFLTAERLMLQDICFYARTSEVKVHFNKGGGAIAFTPSNIKAIDHFLAIPLRSGWIEKEHYLNGRHYKTQACTVGVRTLLAEGRHGTLNWYERCCTAMGKGRTRKYYYRGVPFWEHLSTRKEGIGNTPPAIAPELTKEGATNMN